MSDLTEFLLARIAEDEAVARASLQDDERMTAEAGPLEDPVAAYVTEQANIGLEYVVGVRPARVLAECEAKRRIVGWYVFLTEQTDNPGLEIRHNELSEVLRTLALPYADHPDYDGEWAP